MKHNQKNKLLLFFNGWGMDSQVVSHLTTDDYDVHIISDYCNFSESQLEHIAAYTEITVVAWSMGVWVANSVVPRLKGTIVKRIAINGTCAPLHDTLGIPRANFQATHDGFDERSREKFFLRMCGSKAVYDVFKNCAPQRSVENQKQELKYFLDHATNDQPMPWDEVIIGTGDKIFPFENLKTAWLSHKNVKTIDAPHYPFYLWQSWEMVING